MPKTPVALKLNFEFLQSIKCPKHQSHENSILNFLKYKMPKTSVACKLNLVFFSSKYKMPKTSVQRNKKYFLQNITF